MEGNARLLAHGRSLRGGDYTLHSDFTHPHSTAVAPRRTGSPPLVFLGGRAHAMDDVAGKYSGRAHAMDDVAGKYSGRAHAMDDVAGKYSGRALSGRAHP